MQNKTPNIIKEICRTLRKTTTESEKILWEELRNRKLLGKKFLRQSPVYVFTENSGLDRYVIPDFICKEEKLIIEIDGSIHRIKEVYELDREKELLLKRQEFIILRFTNTEVLDNIHSVTKKIAASFS